MRTIIEIKKTSVMTKLLVVGAMFCICFAFVQQAEVWKAPESAKLKKNPVAPDAAGIAAGKKVYEKECFSCHGKNGKGDGPNSATLEKLPEIFLRQKYKVRLTANCFGK